MGVIVFRASEASVVYLFIITIILVMIHSVIFLRLYVVMNRKCSRLDIAIVNNTMTESENIIREQVIEDYGKLVKINKEACSFHLTSENLSELMNQARKLNGL
jgi:hypothetical protein